MNPAPIRIRRREVPAHGPWPEAVAPFRIGLINRVAAPDQLQQATREWAEKLAQGPTYAIGMSKHLLNRSLESDLDTAFEEEAFAQCLVTQSEDTKEGMRAFVEKRQPRFSGR